MKGTCAVVVYALVGWSLPAAAQTFTVVTYNTHNGSNAASQMHQIATLVPQPDIVVLEEAQVADVPTYASLLNSEYGYQTAVWQGYGFGHQRSDAPHACTGPAGFPDGEGNLILSRLTITQQERLLVFAPDQWWCDRAIGRARIQLSGGALIDVFGYHAPIDATSRGTLMSAFQSWAGNFLVDRTVGGDFNETPDGSTIKAPSGIT